MLDCKKCQSRYRQRLSSLVPLFCFTPYRKSQKEQATGNLFGFLLPCDRKEEALTGNCTPFTPAMACLIVQGDSVSLFRKQHIFQGKSQQTSYNNGPAQGGQP